MAVLRERKSWHRPRRRRTFELSPREAANVRVALRFIRQQFRTWEALARELGCTANVVQRAASNTKVKRWQPSAALALRAAQAAGVPVEDVLSGAWARDIPCPVCGRTG